MMTHRECLAFLSCLEFAVLSSVYRDAILKPKQVICLESIYLNKDVMCILPTGYRKSLIFHMLPMLLLAKGKIGSDCFREWKSKDTAEYEENNPIVIVVSPLNALMSDQISRLNLSGIRSSALAVKEGSEKREGDSEETMVGVDVDFHLCEEDKLRNGRYHIVFTHPEAFISTKYGRELLMTKIYEDNVVTIVVDEAHCILEW